MEVVTSSGEITHLRKEEEEELDAKNAPTLQKYERLLLADEQKMRDIEKPHHHDVLCGRGVTTNRFPGNESFRSLVGLNKELYVSSTKRQKMAISRSIVEAIRSLDPPGRFLDKDLETGFWYDIGHKKAVEKTSQALRDGAATLRKQLSADLGDPDFLNAVFNEDDQGNNVNEDKPKEKEINNAEAINEKEKKENKVKPSEKSRPVKAKSPPMKKGHRRVKSNPSILENASVKRGRYIDESGETPSSAFPSCYHAYPPSPHSPAPPPHARSLPNSPMTWGGGPPYSESPGSFGHYRQRARHSPYRHPSHPSYSPYVKPLIQGRYPRSHSFEYQGGPPPPESGPSSRHHSWSPYGNHHPRYHHHHYSPEPHHDVHHAHHSPPPPRHPPASPVPTQSSSPPPTLVPSHEPFPPGRHRLSPAGYYVKPTHVEWSPRNVNHYPYHSPRGHHASPHPEEYKPSRTPSFPSRSYSPYSHYDDYEHPSSHDSSGLAVPCLGGEGRGAQPRMESMSPKLHLAPRARPTPAPVGQTNYSRREFNRPPISPRYNARPRDDYCYQACSPVEEEKKMAEVDDNDTSHSMPYPSAETSSAQVKLESTLRADADRQSDERWSSFDIEQQRVPNNAVGKEERKEGNGSPGEFMSLDGDASMGDEDDKSDRDLRVDDIAMSPIPFDHEDPATLMELPANILTMPISPCGPHDDPAGSA